MTTQNLQGAIKAVLRGKFIAIQSYQETRKTSNRQPKTNAKRTAKKKKIKKQKERNIQATPPPQLQKNK